MSKLIDEPDLVARHAVEFRSRLGTTSIASGNLLIGQDSNTLMEDCGPKTFQSRGSEVSQW